MSTQPSRVARLALLHVAIFILVPSTAPSDPMDTHRMADAPDAGELILLEDLVEWIQEDSSPAGAHGSLREAIRERPTSFGLFRSFHEEEMLSGQLAEVPFGNAIRRVAARHGVDGLLVASIVEVESRFDPRAVSRRGAIGLMQVMPATAGIPEHEGLFEPELNLDAGTRYLRHLLERYDGDLELALAAYNAGPSNVRRYGGLPPFRETRAYVEKVLGLYVTHHQQVWRGNASTEYLVSG